MRLDQLKGSSNGMRWQLQMQRNAQCGTYRVDMLDEETKIALDIATWQMAFRGSRQGDH